jgi:hypothetical protein
MEHIEILMEPIDTIQVEDVKDPEKLRAVAETIAAMLLATRTHVPVRLQAIPEKRYTVFLQSRYASECGSPQTTFAFLLFSVLAVSLLTFQPPDAFQGAT